MKKEKIVLSFIAVLAGLLVSGIAFYFYQTTKAIPAPKEETITANTLPTPTSFKESIFLNIDNPKDETVTDKKILTVSGKTVKDAIVAISTNTSDEVVPVTSNGNFTTTVNLTDGQNKIEITTIAQNGEEKTVIKTVTYSMEDF